MSEIALYFKYGKENIKRLEQCPSLFQPFYNVKNEIIVNHDVDSLQPTISNEATYDPPFLLSNPYSMTDFIMYRRNKLQLKIDRELLVNKKDGGTVSLDWFDFGVNFKDDTPIIIFSHSLVGGTNEPYIKYFGKYAYDTKGFRSAVFVNRGCSGTPVTADTCGSGSRIDDLEMIIDHIKEKYPSAPLFLVGHCSGSMMNLNHLYKHNEKSPITAYVCISYPIDVGASSDTFTDNPFHSFYFYRGIHKLLVKYYTKYGDRLKKFGTTIEDIQRAKSLREIDQLTIVKMFGYKNSDAYYEDTNKCTQNLEKLKKPVLMFNAKDDIISPYQLIPFKKIKSNENIIMALTKRGGHMGFISNRNRWENWCHRAAVEYISTFIKR
ncbi:alpha/beta hydrolase fold-1 domain-containing protein [Heterostelium album PN500]|uniref:Alpha/beta hydrolase fold-1 domain-containing protein n=1 Tax=Heterostelium pallidum (strain ATCC 26659 / Pp 5 / PN500) TaxID=670386 RepID=D3BEV2_HETP5|nr:alpha/beta hydrolase fold-1 domain-containing protein [Heterostelium album PN500]EFA80433.1 alpha/beta hydrolase fold-1 domain-containing protein [Heterostelium album PN500]|eukprot:XP_020432553.1 alpha/beta hydrolase fold-1 domain-containing protein [Heterostelium album PN500]